MKSMFALAASLLWLCTAATAAPVTVFAAASLQGALDEIVQGHPSEVVLSYGGSGAIARQVAAGAPADVVILASADWMDWIEDQGLLQAGSRRALLSNRMVLIASSPGVPTTTLPDLSALLGPGGRLAMGQRDAVPAGRYAREWLQSSGLWQSVENRLAETDNVRAALALVARGDAPLGVVYVTDALAEPRVHVIYDIPQADHSAIIYPAAALTDAGAAFLDDLAGARAGAIFAAHGFDPVAR